MDDALLSLSDEDTAKARAAAFAAADALMLTDAPLLYTPGQLALAACRSGFSKVGGPGGWMLCMCRGLVCRRNGGKGDGQAGGPVGQSECTCRMCYCSQQHGRCGSMLFLLPAQVGVRLHKLLDRVAEQAAAASSGGSSSGGGPGDSGGEVQEQRRRLGEVLAALDVLGAEGARKPVKEEVSD